MKTNINVDHMQIPSIHTAKNPSQMKVNREFNEGRYSLKRIRSERKDKYPRASYASSKVDKPNFFSSEFKVPPGTTKAAFFELKGDEAEESCRR